MRGPVVFGVLIAMFVAFGLHLSLRSVPDERGAVEADAGPAGDGAARDAGLDGGGSSGDGAVAETPRPVVEEAPEEAPETSPEEDAPEEASETSPEEAPSPEPLAAPRRMDRPLRVVGLDWHVLAPGIVANDGLASGEESRLDSAGLSVEISIAGDALDAAGALAEGGDSQHGADVMILSLPVFAALWPELSALEPRIFLVAGWSAGHHVVVAPEGPPGANAPVEIAAEPGSSGHFLALVLCDLLGVDLSRTRLAAPDRAIPDGGLAPPVEDVTLFAGSPRELREVPRGREALVLGTGAARRAIPYVAVASRRFIERRRDALELFSLTWVRAAEDIAADVPSAARRLGAIDGAPPVLDLLGPLGRLRPSGIEDQARAAGLSGTSPTTIDTLFEVAYGLWLEVGVVHDAPPPEAPVARGAVAGLSRAGLFLEASVGERRRAEEPDAWTVEEPSAALLVARGRAPDMAALERRVGLVLGLFEPLPVRVRGVGPDAVRLERALLRVADLYGVPATRLAPRVEGMSAPGAVGLEVLVPR